MHYMEISCSCFLIRIFQYSQVLLNFSQALEVPIQMFLISFDKVVLKIGPSGDIIEG